MKSSDLRSRIVSPCAEVISKDDECIVDLRSFVERLLLFDQYIFQSIRLLEIPTLVDVFGYEALMELFKSDMIEIHCDLLGLGEIGQDPVWNARKGKKTLPLNSFSFLIVMSGNHKEYVRESLQVINKIENLHIKQKKKLKLAVISKIKKYPDTASQEILDQFNIDLINNTSAAKQAISIALKKNHNIEIAPDKVNIKIEQIDKNDFHAETNLTKILKLDETEIHNILGGALLALGKLIQRIADMRIYSALSGFLEDDIPIFDNKLRFLEEFISPDSQVKRLRRILSLSEFPDLNEAILNKKLDLIKLLEIRDSSECKEFRNWLWSIDDFADEELKDRIGSLKAKLASFIHSNIGKSIRWVATTGIGSIPVAGQVIGIPLSIMDSFLIEKVLPKSGAITFINNMYPSIFRKG